MDSIVNVVNSLKEAKSTNGEYKALIENILRLRNEYELFSNTLSVLTHELERYKKFHSKYEPYGDRLNTSNVVVVTKNANYEPKHVIANLTDNLPNNHVCQLKTPSVLHVHHGKKSECHV